VQRLTKQMHQTDVFAAIQTRCDEDEDGCREELSEAGLQGMEWSVGMFAVWMVRCSIITCLLCPPSRTFKNDPLIDSHIGICTL
jgi:hypothetical protein